jgi:tetratricopeptide (TPR) repeat protein
MKTGIFSLLLIAVGIIALLAVTPLREEARSIIPLLQHGQFSPTQEQLERAAKNLPPSPEVSIALAQTAMAQATKELQSDEDSRPNQLPTDLSLFQKAVEAFPDSPETHLQLAIQALLRCGLFHRPEAWGGVPAPVNIAPEAIPFRAQAAEQLRIAASLAPKNAAPDYLLASLLFAQGDFTAAEASLRAALTKPEWSLYTREARQGLLALYRAIHVPDFYQPFVAPSVGPGVTDKINYRTDFLCLMLVGLEMRQLASGQSQSALFYAQNLLHLGDIILQGADSTDDAGMGSKIIYLTLVPFAPKEKRDQLLKQFSQQSGGEIVKLQANDFRAFLIAQGREDLAGRYDRDQKRIAAHKASFARIAKTSSIQLATTFTAPVVLLALISLLQAGYILCLLVLVSLFSLLLWGTRGPGKAPVWRWWEWGLLMILSFAPAYLAILLTLPPGEKTFIALVQNQMTDGQLLALKSAGIALLLPFLVPLVGGLLKRPPCERERIGKFHAVLSSWRTLLLPAFALLLATALVFGYLAHLRLRPWVAEQDQAMQQGVVQYYKMLPPQ